MITAATHDYPDHEDGPEFCDRADDDEEPTDDLPDIPEREEPDADLIDGWAQSEIYATMHEPK